MRGRYFADESRRNWGNTWKGGDFEVVEEELLGDKKRGREREKDYEKQTFHSHPRSYMFP